MSRLFYHVMQDSAGNLLFDVTGTFRVAGTSTLATIYGDEYLTTILPNPLTNHVSFGSFKCYLDAGNYDFYMAKPGYAFETLTGLQGGGSMANQDADSVAITGGEGQFAHLGLGGPPTTYALTVASGQHSFINGAVGIGDVPSPSTYILNVVGNSRYDGSGEFTGPMGLGTPPVPGEALTVNGGATLTGGTPYALTVPLSQQCFLNGPVGIGDVPNPSYLLNVAGNTFMSGSLQAQALAMGGETPVAGYWIITPTTGNVLLKGKVAIAAGATDDRFGLVVGLKSNFVGSVGIGNIDPLYVLHVEGTAGTPGGAWINSTSRAAFKKAIRPVTDALAFLQHLRPRQWEWARPDLEAQMPGTQAGFVVEEVQTVNPAWTPQDEGGQPGLAMRGLEAYLVAAVQELTAQVQALSAQVETLTAKLAGA